MSNHANVFTFPISAIMLHTVVNLPWTFYTSLPIKYILKTQREALKNWPRGGGVSALIDRISVGGFPLINKSAIKIVSTIHCSNYYIKGDQIKT
jgi:hypothetical protein